MTARRLDKELLVVAHKARVPTSTMVRVGPQIPTRWKAQRQPDAAKEVSEDK
jgi:hypothetical protein